jgi:multidrug resistance protein
MNKKSHPKLMAWLVILAMPLSGMGIDIYSPALVKMTHIFRVPTTQVQSSISIYLLGYGLSQIFWGPLSDRYGRKIITLIGLYVFFICSGLIVWQTNFNMVLLLRLCQGIGIAACNTSNRAILVDLFTGKKFEKYMTYTTISWSLSPIVAPVIGAYLFTYLGWKSCFITLAGYAFFMLIYAHLILQKDKPRLPELNISTLARHLATIFSKKEFNITILIVILLYSIITVFNVTSPFFIQQYLHKSVIFYGHCAAMIGGGWLLGNILTRLTRGVRNPLRVKVALGFLLLTSICLLLFYSKVPLLYAYLISMFIIVSCAGFIFPIAYISSFSLFPHLAGIASAVIGSVFWAGGGLIAEMASWTDLNHPSTLFLFYLILIALLVCIYSLFLPRDAALNK